LSQSKKSHRRIFPQSFHEYSQCHCHVAAYMITAAARARALIAISGQLAFLPNAQ
jgi:hypothetical protein